MTYYLKYLAFPINRAMKRKCFLPMVEISNIYLTYKLCCIHFGHLTMQYLFTAFIYFIKFLSLDHLHPVPHTSSRIVTNLDLLTALKAEKRTGEKSLIHSLVCPKCIHSLLMLNTATISSAGQDGREEWRSSELQEFHL